MDCLISINFLAPIANPLAYDILFDTYMPVDFSASAKKVYPDSRLGLAMYNGLLRATEICIGISCPQGLADAAAYHLSFVESELSPRVVRNTLFTWATANGVSKFFVSLSLYGPLGLSSHVCGGKEFA